MPDSLLTFFCNIPLTVAMATSCMFGREPLKARQRREGAKAGSRETGRGARERERVGGRQRERGRGKSELSGVGLHPV